MIPLIKYRQSVTKKAIGLKNICAPAQTAERITPEKFRNLFPLNLTILTQKNSTFYLKSLSHTPNI